MRTEWTPAEWQRYANALLTTHYGPTNYILVPDRHKGDAGLEGFSVSGHAYQCYAAQDCLSTEQLVGKQKKKIYTDTRKFIENRARLEKIIGRVRVTRWLLLVPEHVSTEVVAYCHSRRTAILEACLPYVDQHEFFVEVVTDNEFAVAKAQLADNGVGRISLGAPTSEADLKAWRDETSNAQQIQVAREKLKRLPRLHDADKLARTEKKLLHGYVHGQKILTDLKEHYPLLFEKVRAIRAARESVLAVESVMGSTDQGQLIGELQGMSQRFADELPALRLDHHSYLGLHTVADWLMRCPLDFEGDDEH